MITIGRVYEKLESYEKDNYYLKDESGEPLKPELIGEGWNQLLGDKVNSVEINEDFYKAMKAGENPITGEQLIESGVNGNHRAGYDITFSPDKTFTISEYLSSQHKEVIDNIKNAALQDTLKILEKDLIQVRMGQDGETVPTKTNNMVAMKVDHQINRDGDPHSHTHIVVFNMSYNEQSQKWQAIHSDAFKNSDLEKIFENQLAYHAKQSGLAVEWVKSDTGKSEYCRISGIPQPVINVNSKRSITIDKVYEENKDKLHEKYSHASVGAIKEKVTTETRAKDKPMMTPEQVRERFNDNLEESGYTKEQILDGIQTAIEASHGKAMTASEVLEKAIENLSDTQSTFTRGEIIKASMQISKGDVSIQEIEQAIQGRVGGLVKLKESYTIQNRGRTYEDSVYTTKNIQEADKYIIKKIDEGRGQGNPYMSKDTIEKYLNHVNSEREAKGEHKLTNSQCETIKFFMTNEDKISAVNGWAGVGKTTIMPLLKDISESQGYKIIGLSETNTAVGEMKSAKPTAIEEMKSAGIDAYTVTKFLTSAKLKSQVDDKTIILIDESSFMGSKHLDELIKFAEERGAKISLWGDKNQLPGVAAGGSTFSYLIYNNKVNYVQNTDIVRQVTEEGREAVRQIYQGNISKAMEMMQVHEGVYEYGKEINSDKIKLEGKDLLNPASAEGLKGGVFKINEYVRDDKEFGFEYFKATNLSTNKDTIIPSYEVIKNAHLNTSKNRTGTFGIGDTVAISYEGMQKSKAGQDYQMFNISQVDLKGKSQEEIRKLGDELNKAGETKKHESMIDLAVKVYGDKNFYDKGLVSADTNKLCDELNPLFRNVNIEQGHLKGEGKIITTYQDKKLQGAERNLIRNYQQGDKLFVIQKGGGISVGKELTITKVDEKRNMVTVSQTDRKGNTQEREIDIRRQGNYFSCYSPKELEIREGEKVMFEKKIQEHEIYKTEIGYIKKIDGDNITVKVGGKVITDKIDKLNYFDYGYISTTHKAQGKTGEKAMYVCPSKAGVQEKFQSALVAETRHKKDIIIITDSKEDLAKVASEYQVNKSPHDIVGEKHNKLVERELKREISTLSRNEESMKKQGKDVSEITKKRDEAIKKLNTLKDIMHNQKVEAKAEGKTEGKTEKKIQDLKPDLMRKGEAHFRVDKPRNIAEVYRQKEYVKHHSLISEKTFQNLQAANKNQDKLMKEIKKAGGLKSFVLDTKVKATKDTATMKQEKGFLNTIGHRMRDDVKGKLHNMSTLGLVRKNYKTRENVVYFKDRETGRVSKAIQITKTEVQHSKFSWGKHQMKSETITVFGNGNISVSKFEKNLKNGQEKHDNYMLKSEEIGAERIDKSEHQYLKQIQSKIESIEKGRASEKSTEHKHEKQGKAEEREQTKDTKADQKQEDKSKDRVIEKSESKAEEKIKDKEDTKSKSSDRGKEDKTEEREQNKSEDREQSKDEDSGRGRSKDIELSL